MQFPFFVLRSALNKRGKNLQPLNVQYIPLASDLGNQAKSQKCLKDPSTVLHNEERYLSG